MQAAENDFEGTRMTIPRARDGTGQGDDGGAFVRVHAGRGQAPLVRVHIGRGQDTCISEQARRTRRTSTVSGVDSVKTVGHARGAAHAQDADGQWSRLCEDGGTRKRRGARAGRRRTVESTVCRRWVFKVTEPSSIPYRTHSGVTGPLPSLGDNQFHHSFVFHIFLVICFDIYFLSKMCNFRRARGAAHAQAADDQWSRRCEDALVATERAV